MAFDRSACACAHRDWQCRQTLYRRRCTWTTSDPCAPTNLKLRLLFKNVKNPKVIFAAFCDMGATQKLILLDVLIIQHHWLLPYSFIKCLPCSVPVTGYLWQTPSRTRHTSEPFSRVSCGASSVRSCTHTFCHKLHKYALLCQRQWFRGCGRFVRASGLGGVPHTPPRSWRCSHKCRMCIPDLVHCYLDWRSIGLWQFGSGVAGAFAM